MSSDNESRRDLLRKQKKGAYMAQSADGLQKHSKIEEQKTAVRDRQRFLYSVKKHSGIALAKVFNLISFCAYCAAEAYCIERAKSTYDHMCDYGCTSCEFIEKNVCTSNIGCYEGNAKKYFARRSEMKKREKDRKNGEAALAAYKIDQKRTCITYEEIELNESQISIAKSISMYGKVQYVTFNVLFDNKTSINFGIIMHFIYYMHFKIICNYIIWHEILQKLFPVLFSKFLGPWEIGRDLKVERICVGDRYFYDSNFFVIKYCEESLVEPIYHSILLREYGRKKRLMQLHLCLNRNGIHIPPEILNYIDVNFMDDGLDSFKYDWDYSFRERIIIL